MIVHYHCLIYQHNVIGPCDIHMVLTVCGFPCRIREISCLTPMCLGYDNRCTFYWIVLLLICTLVLLLICTLVLLLICTLVLLLICTLVLLLICTLVLLLICTLIKAKYLCSADQDGVWHIGGKLPGVGGLWSGREVTQSQAESLPVPPHPLYYMELVLP